MSGIDPSAFEENTEFLAGTRTFWSPLIISPNVNFLGYISSRMNSKTKQPLKFKHEGIKKT